MEFLLKPVSVAFIAIAAAIAIAGAAVAKNWKTSPALQILSQLFTGATLVGASTVELFIKPSFQIEPLADLTVSGGFFGLGVALVIGALGTGLSHFD